MGKPCEKKQNLYSCFNYIWLKGADQTPRPKLERKGYSVTKLEIWYLCDFKDKAMVQPLNGTIAKQQGNKTLNHG